MKARTKKFGTRAVAMLLSAVTAFSTFPVSAGAAQVNSYHDPAEHWMQASGRTNELDVNAVVTHETFNCGVCGKATSFQAFRIPEYTRDGQTAMNRNVKYSDGTMVGGSGTGTILDGVPGQNASYTGYHWTKAVCEICGTVNSNMSINDYGFGKNVYWLYDCDSKFMQELPEQKNYDYVDSTYHKVTTTGGEYCAFCYGTNHTKSSVLERHDMEKEILSQPANGRFAIVEKCKDCDYAKYEYVGAKSVVASYYGVVDGAPHTISVTDLSDAGVRTEIRYGNSADSCTMTSAPNYTDKGQYDVYYQITYTYQGVEMTENGVANVWLHDETTKDDGKCSCGCSDPNCGCEDKNCGGNCCTDKGCGEKHHFLRPAAYAVEQGATGYERYFEDNEENRYIWSENSVRGILRSPIYAGNLAGYKRIAANMKSKKRPSKLPEEWEVIPDTHEGIVTQEEFDTVQQLMTSRRREQNAGGFENIFSGVIKCADCGYAMRAASANRRKRPDIIDCVQYTCNNYGRYGNVMCTAHSIEARDLFNAVLADINRFADMAVNDEKAVRAIERRLTETDQSRAKSLEKEKKKLNKRLAELDRLFSSLYEDKVMERITERNFEMMSGKYQKEQLEIEARLKEVTETLNDSYEKSQGVRDFLSLIRNYQGLKELDATIINALIDKILVSEREKLADGTVRQEIKIYYKFIGFVGELHITPTKRWTALKPKNCTVCGVEYVPSSGISKYCPACAKRIQREKSNESKRRSRERNRRACIELSAKNDRLIYSSAKAALSVRAMRTRKLRFTPM